MTEPTTTQDIINWIDSCPQGECRTEELFDCDGLVQRRIRDRRPIVTIQHAAGASATQTLNIGDAREHDVIASTPRDRRWLDMSISELLAKAPPSTDVCAFRDYMEMVKTLVQNMSALVQDAKP